MKFFKLDLLTLLISLFILNSCKNQDTIGLGVTSSSTQLNGTLIDTSTIIVNTIPEDTVITNALGKTPFGLFNDPIFGTTEADLAIDLESPSGYTIPTGTVTIDSAMLVLRYANGFYGDSLTTRYKANVYQLSERMYSAAQYYNTRSWKYNSSTLLGTQSFFSRTHDTIGIGVVLPGIRDSIQRVPAQLRIPIDKNFINNLLFNANANQLGSNLLFENYVNGLYLTMDKSGTTGPGGIFMMALDSSARIDVYYKSLDGTTIDTTVTSIPSTLHAAQIKHTYTSAIQTELNNQKTGSRNVIYLQGTAGLRAKISFPYLKNIIKTVGNIVINRAELVITPNPSSIIPFAPIPKITMYRYDIAGQRAPLQDANAGDPRYQGVPVFGGYYSYLPNSGLVYPGSLPEGYHFVITGYISDLMNGVSPDYGTFLGAIDNTNISSVDIAATPQVASRSVAIGTDKTSPYRITLNIIYTKIAQPIPANPVY